MKRFFIILTLLTLLSGVVAAQETSKGVVARSADNQSVTARGTENQGKPEKKVRNEFAITLAPRIYVGTAIYTDMIGGAVGIDYALNRLMGPIDLDFGVNYAYMVDKKNDSGNIITSMDIQVPISLRYGLIAGKSRILFYAGPLVEYGISLTQKTSDGAVTDMYQGNYNRMDIMGGGGIGLVAGRHFRLTIDAYYGFMSRRKTISTANNIQTSLGISFLF